MKKFLSLVLALVMTMSLVTISAGATDFTDDSKINYGQAVDVVSAVKIVDGYTDGSFNPQATLTRGAAAKIICNLMLGPTTAGALVADAAPYKDVPANSTFAGYIAYCAKEGIISGYADGTFRPGNTLTGYAFMKMLLGALGYDKDIEGYDGANWSINVAKRALAIGLDSGLKGDFNGVKPVTREEACLYAFNTLQADLVEYDQKTNISVGGAEVVIAGSNAKAMTWNNSATKKTNIKDDNYVQFAEQYFNKLVKASVTDDFGQPATKWTNSGKKIGTYNKAPAKTYAKNVTLGTIYADLNMNQADEAVVYLNGELVTPVKVSKNNQVKIASSSANYKQVDTGSTVNVYYDADENDVTICVIDNFVGEISNVDSKASTPYVNVSAFSTVKDKAGSVVTVKPKFETSAAFAEDDVVLFTYSVSAGAVKSVKAAESVEGTISKYEKATSLTLGETTYKYSKNIAFSFASESNMNTKNDYVVYLDENGNAIYVDEKTFDSSEYALVLAVEAAAQTGFTSDRAKLLTSEGKLMTVSTDDDYTGYAAKIVNYRKDDKGLYALRLAANAEQNDADIIVTPDSGTNIKDYGLLHRGPRTFAMSNTNAWITVKTGETRYANSETVFVVMNTNRTTGKTEFNVYTGIKNAPTISSASGVEAVWTMRGNVVGIMFIDATNADITNGKKDILFLAGAESVSDLITDSDNSQYYLYNAVCDGEIKTVKVLKTASGLTAGDDVNGVYTNAQTNNKGIITSVSNVSTVGYTKVSATGVWKLSGDYTLGLTAAKTRYTVASDAKMFRIDTDGNITKIDDVKDIYSDASAKVIALLDNTTGDLAYVYVQEVNTDPKDNVSIETPVTPLTSITPSTSGGKLQVVLAGTTEDEVYSVSVTMTIGGIATDLGTFKVTGAAGSSTTKVLDLAVSDGITYVVSCNGVKGAYLA